MKIKNCKAILIIIASFLLTVNVFALNFTSSGLVGSGNNDTYIGLTYNTTAGLINGAYITSSRTLAYGIVETPGPANPGYGGPQTIRQFAGTH